MITAMNIDGTSGPRKIPESERKFGLTLGAQLHLRPEEPVDVIIVGRDDSDDEGFMESVNQTLTGVDGVTLVGGVLLSATVNPPEVRSKLIIIAENDHVAEIIIDEPLMPPHIIPKSNFR